MDEVFGEENFVATAIWQNTRSPKNSARHLSEDHNFIVIYATAADKWIPNLPPRTDTQNADYRNRDDDPRGPWRPNKITARNPDNKEIYPITCPSGRVIKGPPKGSYWRLSKEKLAKLDADGRIWWGKDGDNIPARKVYLSEVKQGRVPPKLWTYNDVGHTQDAKREILSILDFDTSDDVFGTVEPSSLIRRVLEIATDKDSIVVDSFAGSGTTAHAVLALNKEDGGRRRFVLIECKNYVDSITAERVRRVVKGVPTAKDPVLKTGFGGSFSYFKLGNPLCQESLLDGSALPSYQTLAAYVFFAATGEEIEVDRVQKNNWFIGRSRLHEVFLIYEPDVEQLKNLALTLDSARGLPDYDGRHRLVFAPMKYLDQEFMAAHHITFQQLPFQIYETIAQTVKRLSRDVGT